MIFAKNFAKNHEKNTWDIRRLVNDSFIPSSKRPSVLHCKLTDFFSMSLKVGNLEQSTIIL